MNTAVLARTEPAPAHGKPLVTSATHHVESVLWVRHWTDQYFSFAITRPASFRFRSGEFVMIGLPGEDGGKPVMRAYSIASPSYADTLEFFSIKVTDGPLTSRLQKIGPGDQILMAKKPVGTLVLDALQPGRRLFLLGTGTGLAPWLSVARDPDVYDAFERVIVAHCVREVRDLAYRELFQKELPADEVFGELATNQLTYLPTVTREPFEREGRITDLVTSGRLFRDAGLDQTVFNPENDRVMLCGSMHMIKDVAAMLEAQGLVEGSNSEPGDFVLERAFVG
ncbi:ferredoxin--NADP reductase [Caulobacter sp. S45]|uniref:ferredoxin--NADP reductase n=1 Tax=Caulobacter sp. S45 TaxID=1641861 RepID=UPI0015770BAF|nr:ferredoxin--NADP reductase [Caulobacter sp. S45]